MPKVGQKMDPSLKAIFEQLNELIASQVEIKNAISAGQDQQVADKTNWRKAKRYKRGYKHQPRTIQKRNKCHQDGPRGIRKENARQFSGFMAVTEQHIRNARMKSNSELQAT
jgi:hypothetical protein